jgi:hypothetical protein
MASKPANTDKLETDEVRPMMPIFWAPTSASPILKSICPANWLASQVWGSDNPAAARRYLGTLHFPSCRDLLCVTLRSLPTA